MKWLFRKIDIKRPCLRRLANNEGLRISELIQFLTDLIDENNVFDGVFRNNR